MPNTASPSIAILNGGEWLLKPTAPDAVFTPECLTEEHRLIAQTVTDFVTGEVLPHLDRLEQKDWAFARALVRRCGELGLIGVDVADAYGGVDLDKVTSIIVSDRMSRSASFGATFGAQVNLTVLPLVLFGTEDQKRRYLPRLLAGELVGAYCLSEPGSGSDALGARTRATRQRDGSFVLNGEKMWITNGGLADVFIVFAKVDGDRFSAFIVERGFGGITSGKEEHKMGLHGSSTTPVLLQDVSVPAANLLGEVGQGHKIAFNVLNFARFKLGAICAGGAVNAIGEAARYAAQRKQFGVPIASFGMIKHKLGEMVSRTYAIESLVYRTVGMIDARIAATPHEAVDPSVALATFEEYNTEASIAKVAGSEALDYVLDENIQIHGGNGFVRDYPAERHYRDSRVNRIFEGTNEINRLLIPTLLARRAARGVLPLGAAAAALQKRPSPSVGRVDSLVAAHDVVESLKKAGVIVLGLAVQTYGGKLGDEQEVVMHTADILSDVYAAESAVLRASSDSSVLSARASLHAAAARVFVNDAAMRVRASARQALAAMVADDRLGGALSVVDGLSNVYPANTATLRRELADAAVARGAYPFA